MKLIKGKKISAEILRNLKQEIKSSRLSPGLTVVLIGKNKASETYVGLKKKAAEKVGINFELVRFSEKVKESEIIKKIKELNSDKKIHGIIVQLPLPEKFKQQQIINAIDPKKDADGFHPESTKLFLRGKSEIQPVFPAAIMKCLDGLFGKKSVAVAVVNSKKFGEIICAVLALSGIKAEYILVKNMRKNLLKIKNADIVISAVGKPSLITGVIIKKGAIVIDGGITKKGKKVVGDVDFESARKAADYLSPVPGGVGPVTVACLLRNVYLLAKKPC